ncbi:hypothetical protein CD139_08095 [Staphylococcus piscifermentans]|nr:hypothetical protein CD139_08095 [Staphylococcus piscifermentans]
MKKSVMMDFFVAIFYSWLGILDWDIIFMNQSLFCLKLDLIYRGHSVKARPHLIYTLHVALLCKLKRKKHFT